MPGQHKSTATASSKSDDANAKVKRIVFAPWDPEAPHDQQTPNHAFTMIRTAVLGSGKKPGSASDWTHARRLIEACAGCEATRKAPDERDGYEGRERIITDLKVSGATMTLGTGEWELLREMWRTLKPKLDLGAAKSVCLADRIFADLAKSDTMTIDAGYGSAPAKAAS